MRITGKSYLSVIIPENATSRELFAAQELEKYLKQIFSGIDVCILKDNESVTGKKILIGGPERNQATAAYISVEAFDS